MSELGTPASRVAAVASKLENPATDSTGHHNNRFVSLAALLNHVRPALAAAKLAIFQDTSTDEFGVGVSTTFVCWETGEGFSTGRLSFPVTDPQRAGAAITYAKRYQLLAALGMAGTEDDKFDGSAPQSTGDGSRADSGTPGPANRPTDNERPASRNQIVAIQARMRELNLDDRGERLSFASNAIGRDIASSNELTIEEGTRVLRALDDLEEAGKR